MKLLQNLKMAVLNIPRKGRHNIVKILCLGAGMAMGAVIIAEVYYEQTYDTWFPNHERTYLVNEMIVHDGEYKEYPQTSGAIAKGLKDNCPQIEAATKIGDAIYDMYFITDDEKEFKLTIPIADPGFFDVFGNRVVHGDLKKSLDTPMHCVVSRSFAEKIGGGNVVGKHLTNKNKKEDYLTIGGVYEDFPYGSSFHGIDVILAFDTFKASRDFSNMWIGADRFHSYVRLQSGVKPEDLKPNIQKMKDAHGEFAEAKKAGVDMDFSFTQISDAYRQSDIVKRMCWIMSLLAVILLFSTVMNYLLIVIGNMVGRFREMAVRKCYGATPKNVHAIVLTEAIVHVVLGIGVAALLLFLCKGTVEELISAPLKVLIFNRGAWLLGLMVLVVILVGGVLPGWLYARIPVTAAFRGVSEAKHRWKLGLLAFEFLAVGLLFCLLMVVHRQYQMMVNDHPGYDYENLAVVTVNGVDRAARKRAETELRKMPEVEMVSSAHSLPIHGASGNNIYLPGEAQELFNVADQYEVTDNYFQLMNIPIVEGRGFTAHSDSLHEVMVDERFVEKMKKTVGWTGSIVGKRISITEHNMSPAALANDNVLTSGDAFHTICGVYRNYRIGSLMYTDQRPSVLFYSSNGATHQMVKFHKLTPENIETVKHRLEELYPNHEVDVTAYSFYVWEQYTVQNHFRKGVMICGLMILVISLIGLIGYVIDEVNRRRKEIAIRKVNGATLTNVLRMFIKDVTVVALPALVMGAVIAYYIAKEWLQTFSERVSLNPIYFLLCILVLLIVIVIVVVANCYKIANSNPVDYLKTE